MSRLVPFTREVFLGLFEQYNAAVWPAQPVAYALGLLVLLSALKPYKGSGRLIAAVLAAAWIWNGVAYHMLHFATLVWAAWAFGFLFVVQGLMFLGSGVLRGRLAFRFQGGVTGWIGIGMALFAMAAYPLIGALTGQGLPRIPPFGLAPCPTAIFTLGMLLLAAPRVPMHLLVIPLLWSIVGGAVAWQIDIPQDLALPAAAALAVVLGLRKYYLSRA
ncbi:MAG: hypothetical protein GEU87_05965 [Alphaproteobacteria bacterium]|nr:hypothetical protein [Alphaproteobacteria bacterium]